MRPGIIRLVLGGSLEGCQCGASVVADGERTLRARQRRRLSPLLVVVCPQGSDLRGLITFLVAEQSLGGAGVASFPVSCKEGMICLGPRQGQAAGPAV